MAVPRVFISSTFYDLKHVRNDLESFIESLGYEPVLHDKGKVTYSQNESLEISCYSELSTCDIVIGIIGNRFGSESFEGNYSITMQELKSALKDNKKIYIFIDSNVYIENNTYIANKDKVGLEYPAVDDVRIHEFVAELKNVVKNHPIQKFDNVSEIITFLKLQFAGLLQQLLRREASIVEQNTYSDLKELLSDFKENNDCFKSLVLDFDSEKSEFTKRLSGARLLANHFSVQLTRLLGLKNLKIAICDKIEINELLFVAGYDEIENLGQDINSKISEDEFKNYYIYEKDNNNKILEIKISKNVFTKEGKLNWISSGDWKEDYLVFEEIEKPQGGDFVEIDADDDLPF